MIPNSFKQTAVCGYERVSYHSLVIGSYNGKVDFLSTVKALIIYRCRNDHYVNMFVD